MLTRRTFVAWAAGAVPIALVARRAEAWSVAWIQAEDATLLAIAEAILPSAANAAMVAKDFQRWIDEYKEGAEVTHGYGTSALRRLPASPKPRWAAQLEKLRTRFSAAAAPPVSSRPTGTAIRDIVRDELKAERIDRMPAVGQAQHVAVALLAFYYSSSAANDLCYESQIGRETCRPLARQSRKPLPLIGARS